MEYVVNLMSAESDPVEWARRREGEGWHHLSVPDHLFLTRPYPHVWVTAAAIAAATSTVGVTTAFVNNLLRHPVEVAQATLSMHNLSHGRFSLGLGAGWLQSEIEAIGHEFPEPRDRAGAFIEAVQIIGSLVRTGICSWHGDYYDVEVEMLGPIGGTPPPVIAAVGGPRTIREVTPHVQAVELKAASAATRGGALDFGALAAIPQQHVADMVARVRAVAPDIGISIFAMVSVGEGSATRGIKERLGDGLYSRFVGSPIEVAESMEWLSELGITRVQLSPYDDPSLDALAQVVL